LVIAQQEKPLTRKGESTLEKHFDAGYPMLLYATTEEERIIREARRNFPGDVQFFRWDMAAGYRAFINPNGDENAAAGYRAFINPNGDENAFIWKTIDGNVNNPIQAIQQIHGLPGYYEDDEHNLMGGSVVFMHDMNAFFDDPMIQRHLLNIKDHLKDTRKMIVFLASDGKVPGALRDSVKALDFAMPDDESLYALLKKIAIENGLDIPNNFTAIVDAMKGLTYDGAENALGLSLVEAGKFDHRIIIQDKARVFGATGYLVYHQYSETFDDLFGLDHPKELVPHAIKSNEGVMTINFGVPGTGKSHFFKAVGNEVQRATLELSLPGLRRGIVGETESNTADAFKRISAFNKPIVFIDEVEKALSGVGTGGQSDGGIGDRIGMALLQYMEDHQGEAYFGMTCNDIEPILSWSSGALASRADAIFFLDMPTKEECQGIARIWSEKKNVDIPKHFNFEGWTGRDIKKLARTMSMMECDAEKASEFIVPTAQMLGPRLDKIRQKAQNVCLSASKVETVAPSVRKIKLAR
jgi:hypothetical protein